MLINFQKNMKLNKQTGQVSRLLLVLAIIVFVAVIITYLILKMASPPPKPPDSQVSEVPLPVFEKQLGDILFIFQSAIDRGNVLKASEITNKKYNYAGQSDLKTGERFIQVTVGAKNMGTKNTIERAWDIENIVDSKNREYVPINTYNISPWLPEEDLCGSVLKPAFQPTPCVKIYEVSKESSGLRIRVIAGKGNSAVTSSPDKVESFLLDLIVK